MIDSIRSIIFVLSICQAIAKNFLNKAQSSKGHKEFREMQLLLGSLIGFVRCYLTMDKYYFLN